MFSLVIPNTSEQQSARPGKILATYDRLLGLAVSVGVSSLWMIYNDLHIHQIAREGRLLED